MNGCNSFLKLCNTYHRYSDQLYSIDHKLPFLIPLPKNILMTKLMMILLLASCTKDASYQNKTTLSSITSILIVKGSLDLQTKKANIPSLGSPLIVLCMSYAEHRGTIYYGVCFCLFQILHHFHMLF